jgi:hypothetical protein
MAHCQEGFARNSKCVHMRSAVWPLQTHKSQEMLASTCSLGPWKLAACERPQRTRGLDMTALTVDHGP